MPRKNKGNLYRKEGSPFWWYEFQHGGRRYRGSTGTKNERDARAVARAAKDQARRDAELVRAVTSDAPPLEFGPAALRYFEERGQHLAGAKDRQTDLLRIGEYLGASKLLTDIRDEDVKGLIQWRRAQRVVRKGETKKSVPLVSSATVNRSTTVVLQALITWAKDEWKVQFPNEPKWRKLKLEEPRKVARVLRGKERERLDAATRADYADIIDFAFQSSKRRAYCMGLKWDEINWAEDVIQRPGKRKPDGTEKLEKVAITPGIRKILASCKGHHPVYVFTFRAQRTRGRYVKGQHYPMTVDGFKSAWRLLCKKAEVENFGFHGTRRTRATSVYGATKDLVAVQKMLGHAHITTTIRYLGLDLDEVRDAMEATDAHEAGLAMDKTEASDAKGLQQVPPMAPPNRNPKAA